MHPSLRLLIMPVKDGKLFFIYLSSATNAGVWRRSLRYDKWPLLPENRKVGQCVPPAPVRRGIEVGTKAGGTHCPTVETRLFLASPLCSRARQSAPFTLAEDQRRLTSAATVQGFKTRHSMRGPLGGLWRRLARSDAPYLPFTTSYDQCGGAVYCLPGAGWMT